MSVSINRLVGAKGAEYLLRTIAHGDGRSAAGSALTRYYAESGTPPGRWFGAGLTQLDDGRGIEAGSEVGEDQLRNMLGGGFDPVTMKPLGKVLSPYLKQTGPDGKPIERRSVTGFDLTFSVPKSVSAMWAIADGGTQAIIYEAHQEAIRQALVWAEEHVFFSRSGHNGVLQERIHGVVGAGFDHWDSRAADPQLHTHLVIQNRAKSVSDGQWRTLDSRAIYKATVTLSELHQVLLQDELTRRLGVGWDPRTRTHSHVPKWEVTGVSDALQAEFSQRSAAIAVHKDEQVAAFEATHSRKPTAVEVLRMRQAATLATREDKHEHSLADLTEQWRERARTYVGEDTVSFVESLARNDMPLLRADDLTDDMLTELGTVALTGVTEKRATFTRANVHAELSRRMAEIRFASAADRIAATERAATIAVESALRISADELHHTPDAYRDQKAGVSRFRGVGTELFTTTALLDAEHRLVETSHLTTGPRVNLDTIDATVGDDEHGQRRNMTGKKHGLSDEQLAAVADIATSGRIVDVLVGPAGTGKSTTMAGLRQAWEHHHGDGSVVGAAPSAAAAEVLSGELGIACENTAKWLTELAATGRRQAELHRLEHPTLTPEQARAAAQHAHTRLAAAEQTGNEATIKAAKQDYFDLLALTSPQRRADRIAAVKAELQQWTIKPGQLLIVDEASLAGTFALDELRHHVATAGAKMLLVGDWAQLAAVDAGGAFSLLVHDRGDAPQLAEVRRFEQDWEKAASLLMRLGHRECIADYQQAGRIVGGTRDALLDKIYDDWRADLAGGDTSVMIAGDNQVVAALNTRARTDLIAAGVVRGREVPIADELHAARGDRVITRHNDRRLTTSKRAGGWVKNGDQWDVVTAHRDGSLTVKRSKGGGTLRLPTSYVREHVQLAYASTTHRAQGITVQHGRSLIDPTTTREANYVGATRGRIDNTIYVDTAYDPTPDTSYLPADTVTVADVLTKVLANIGAEQSATATIAAHLDDAQSLPRLYAEYTTIAADADLNHWTNSLTRAGLDADQLQQSPAWGPLVAALRTADSLGVNLDTTLPQLVTNLPDDQAAVLHYRIDTLIKTLTARGAKPRRDRSIIGLIPAAHADDPSLSRALAERARTMEQRVDTQLTRALETHAAWTRLLGTPPTDPALHQQWWTQARIMAAFRELHDATTTPDKIVEAATTIRERSDARVARAALQQAQQLAQQAAAQHSGTPDLRPL